MIIILLHKSFVLLQINKHSLELIIKVNLMFSFQSNTFLLPRVILALEWKFSHNFKERERERERESVIIDRV
jgi:hypothetical protein